MGNPPRLEFWPKSTERGCLSEPAPCGDLLAVADRFGAHRSWALGEPCCYRRTECASTDRSARRALRWATSGRLERPASGEDRRDRLEQNLQIEQWRPRIDVLEIELHPAVEIELTPPLDLPQAGEPGAHR